MNANREPLRYRVLDSPIGPLVIAGSGEALHFLGLPTGDRAARVRADWVEDSRWGAAIAEQLAAYFAGTRRIFDVKLSPRGTAFQHRVWRALVEIPYGETRTYGQVAALVGAPRAVRAVGRANATNPIPIIVPCHRVIGSNGTLTGYGGGLGVKRWLLDLESHAIRLTPGPHGQRDAG